MTDWVMIETDVLKKARARLGLSYEAVARQLPVSSKTYERWEKAGRVPRTDLSHLAEILELEIEAPAPERLHFKEAGRVRDVDAEILARLERIEKLLPKG